MYRECTLQVYDIQRVIKWEIISSVGVFFILHSIIINASKKYIIIKCINIKLE